ncbi:DUF3293 domain-containing protein [Caldimonas tepidiphila]|uniref:DUF3293 domain-containing protein n=1 Tax=Caldimonas tepidiphila TaxID=2315841 RepID=UPI000E5BE63C|nr:DUF3293 domain-containing protein [Caldimonas tepidiphila]
MKVTIRNQVAGEKLVHLMPPSYRDEARKGTRPEGRYSVLLFAHASRDVVPSPPVRKALRRLQEPAPDGIVAVGTVFTAEALGLLREAGARVVAMRKSRWTDESARQRQLKPGPLGSGPQAQAEGDTEPVGDAAPDAPEGSRDPDDIRGLLGAYRDTDYQVEGLPSPLRPGAPHPGLDAYLAQQGARSLAILTAYNPRSETLSLAENAQRQGALREQLEQHGLRFVDATGRDREGEARSPEPLLGVFDAPPELILRLMEEFGQNAAVLAEAGTPPRLLLLPAFERELVQDGPDEPQGGAQA